MALQSVNGQAKAKNQEAPSDVVRTPAWLIDIMWQWVLDRGGRGNRFLDPCAGDGRIMDKMPFEDGYIFEVEITDDLVKIEPPNIKRAQTNKNDFFAQVFGYGRKRFDFCLMNPPFSKCQAYHFAREVMENWLEPDGAIIVIAPIYILTQNKVRRQWLHKHITRIAFLPQQTFHPDCIVHAVLMQLENKDRLSKLQQLEFIER